MYCQNCGFKMEDSSKFCSKCGKPVGHDIQRAPSDNLPSRNINVLTPGKSIFFWLIWSLFTMLCSIMVLYEFSIVRFLLLAVIAAALPFLRKKLFKRVVPSMLLWMLAFTVFLAISGVTVATNTNNSDSFVSKISVRKKAEGITVIMPNWVLPEAKEITVRKDM